MPARLFKLRPLGPWRLGTDSGDPDRAGHVCHSDTLYSALSAMMIRLGHGDEWFDATARAESSAVRVSSIFPWQDDAIYAPPPAHLWPPRHTARIRASGARLVPTYLVGQLAAGQPFNEDQWDVDALSECLLRRGRRRAGPFRVALRSRAAVDRLDHGSVHPHQSACIEFSEGAGVWCVAETSDDEWATRVEAAMRLLGDTGIGGGRSRGQGHFEIADTRRGELLTLVLGRRIEQAPAGSESGHWMLSLLSPAAADQIDWTRGAYTLLDRGGRVDSPAGPGAVKRVVRMVREGSMLMAPEAPRGSAPDVAPDGFPHPVYRGGFGVSAPLPWRVNA